MQQAPGKYLVLLLLVLGSYPAAGQHNTRPAADQRTSPGLQVIDTLFTIPSLNRPVSISLYLPASYQTAHKNYPVLYIYGGPSVFSKGMAGENSWNVDRSLDSLALKGRQNCIVVAVDDLAWKNDSSLHFMEEADEQMKNYADFFAHTLKPYIDRHFKTLTAKENTIIAGADIGGLIAFNTLLQYPSLFGKAGIFSPAFLTIPELNIAEDPQVSKLSAKIFFYMGDDGEMDGPPPVIAFTDKLATNSQAMIYLAVGTSNDITAWCKWFPGFYNFIMADGFNDVIRMEE